MSDWSCIEGGRHDNDAQIGSLLLQTFQQRQREIPFQVALMKFIEHYGVDTIEPGIR
jgi:hypothetical protein